MSDPATDQARAAARLEMFRSPTFRLLMMLDGVLVATGVAGYALTDNFLWFVPLFVFVPAVAVIAVQLAKRNAAAKGVPVTAEPPDPLVQ